MLDVGLQQRLSGPSVSLSRFSAVHLSRALQPSSHHGTQEARSLGNCSVVPRKRVRVDPRRAIAHFGRSPTCACSGARAAGLVGWPLTPSRVPADAGVRRPVAVDPQARALLPHDSALREAHLGFSCVSQACDAASHLQLGAIRVGGHQAVDGICGSDTPVPLPSSSTRHPGQAALFPSQVFRSPN